LRARTNEIQLIRGVAVAARDLEEIAVTGSYIPPNVFINLVCWNAHFEGANAATRWEVGRLKAVVFRGLNVVIRA
jgi:hypothetical protein